MNNCSVEIDYYVEMRYNGRLVTKPNPNQAGQIYRTEVTHIKKHRLGPSYDSRYGNDFYAGDPVSIPA